MTYRRDFTKHNNETKVRYSTRIILSIIFLGEMLHICICSSKSMAHSLFSEYISELKRKELRLTYDISSINSVVFLLRVRFESSICNVLSLL